MRMIRWRGWGPVKPGQTQCGMRPPASRAMLGAPGCAALAVLGRHWGAYPGRRFAMPRAVLFCPLVAEDALADSCVCWRASSGHGAIRR
jgi:hypothetical protein